MARDKSGKVLLKEMKKTYKFYLGGDDNSFRKGLETLVLMFDSDALRFAKDIKRTYRKEKVMDED